MMITLLNIGQLVYLIFITLGAIIICCQRFSWSYASFISIGLFVLITSLLAGISGNLWLGVSISSCLIIILQLMNQLKVHYYKERLFFSDFDVALDFKNAETLKHYPSAFLALICLILFLLGTIYCFYATSSLNLTLRIICVVIAILLGISIYFCSKKRSHIEDWQSSLPKGKNTITNLFISAQNNLYSPPVYPNSEKDFLSQAVLSSPQANSASQPDIIVVLQESTVNPNYFQILNSHIPNLAMFCSSNTTKAINPLRVQTFGGGTWLSEFSFLTGLNPDDFSFRKNSVFYTVAPHIQTSIFKELKRNGYFTVVLSTMHPANYNAGNTYQHLGVDLILQPQDLGHPASKDQNLWDIPSSELFEYAKKVLEKYTDKPIFLYTITMAEHGPYQSHTQNFLQISEQDNDKKFIPLFNDYFARLQLLSDASIEFLDYLKSRSRPMIFSYFGDHQPHFGFHTPYNISSPRPDYLTQFVLHDNFNHQPLANLANPVDLSFLAGIILERAGLSVSPFFAANIALRHITQGELEDYTDQQLIDSYKHYIYQIIKQAGE